MCRVIVATVMLLSGVLMILAGTYVIVGSVVGWNIRNLLHAILILFFGIMLGGGSVSIIDDN